jgi:hypothetical protein
LVLLSSVTLAGRKGQALGSHACISISNGLITLTESSEDGTALSKGRSGLGTTSLQGTALAISLVDGANGGSTGSLSDNGSRGSSTNTLSAQNRATTTSVVTLGASIALLLRSVPLIRRDVGALGSHAGVGIGKGLVSVAKGSEHIAASGKGRSGLGTASLQSTGLAVVAINGTNGGSAGSLGGLGGSGSRSIALLKLSILAIIVALGLLEATIEITNKGQFLIDNGVVALVGRLVSGTSGTSTTSTRGTGLGNLTICMVIV